MKKIAELPQLTAETFEQFVAQHTDGRNYRPKLKGIEKPRNSAQFRELTRKLYGIELDVECFAYGTHAFGEGDHYKYSANYRIVCEHEDGQQWYAKQGIMPLWDKKYGQYDGLKVVLDWCFGELTCGGVAHVHYGQTKGLSKSDHQRIMKWGSQEANRRKHAIDQHRSLVEIFGHNPFA